MKKPVKQTTKVKLHDDVLNDLNFGLDFGHIEVLRCGPGGVLITPMNMAVVPNPNYDTEMEEYTKYKRILYKDMVDTDRQIQRLLSKKEELAKKFDDLD